MLREIVVLTPIVRERFRDERGRIGERFAPRVVLDHAGIVRRATWLSDVRQGRLPPEPNLVLLRLHVEEADVAAIAADPRCHVVRDSGRTGERVGRDEARAWKGFARRHGLSAGDVALLFGADESPRGTKTALVAKWRRWLEDRPRSQRRPELIDTVKPDRPVPAPRR
jgi:hypothetical protein